jgi:hypothetical protein
MRRPLDTRRILLGAMVLAVVVGFAGRSLLRASSVRELPDAAPPAATFDVGDADTRVALRYLQGDDPGAWLGNDCDADSPDRYRVEAIPGNRPGALHRQAHVVLGGNSAQVEYREAEFRLPPDAPAWRRGNAAAEDVRRFEQRLADAGYPASIPPSPLAIPPDPPLLGCLDAGVVKLESCVGGRYYGFARGCGQLAESTLVDGLLDFAKSHAGEPR